MEFEISPIKIQLDTNIPGKSSIVLTKSILYNPTLSNTGLFSEYPYFTMDVEYPSIHLNSLSYEKRVEFFFNKDTMLKTLKIYRSAYFAQPKKDAINIEISNDKIKGDSIQYENQIEKLQKEIKEKQIELTEAKKEEKIKKKYGPIKTLLQNIKADLDELFKSNDGKNRVPSNTAPIKGDFLNKTFPEVIKQSQEYSQKYINALKNTGNEYFEKKATNFETKFKETDNFTGGSKILEIIKLFTEIEKDSASLVDRVNSLENSEKKDNNDKIEIITNDIKSKEAELENTRNAAKEISVSTVESKQREQAGQIITQKENEKKATQLKNSENNIMLMLQLLFPIKYPILGDISSSFNQIIMKKTEINTTFNDFLPAFLKNKLIPGITDYSYLKIDGKIYTITQVVWLNDIYNHKEYSKLIDQYKQLNKQKQNDASQLISETEKLKKKFKYNYGKNNDKSFDETAIKYFNGIIDNLSDNKDSDAGKSHIFMQTESQKNIGLLKQFIAAIEKFKVSIDKNEPEFIDTAKNMVDIYKTLPSISRTNQKYTNTINSMSKEIDKIQTNEYINYTYIGSPGINLNYKDDEPKYIEILKSKYNYYTSFVDSIKQFRAPEKVSTNYVLQDTINDFLDNTEEFSFGPNIGPFSFLMNPYNIDINPFSTVPSNAEQKDKDKYAKEKAEYKQRMNTGVTILPTTSVKDAKYEIYVQVNVIAGELNDDNTKLVDCLYKGETLGEKLEYLLNKTLGNPWDLKTTRLFFDISQGDAAKTITQSIELAKSKGGPENKEIPDNKQIPLQDNKQIPLQENKMQGGGVHTRRLRSNLLRKTFKSYH